MPFWLKIVLLYVVLAVGLVLLLGFDLRTGLDLVILACAIIPAIIKKSQKLYLIYSRLRYYVRNIETTWNLTFSLQGHFDLASINNYVKNLVLSDPKCNEILSLSPTRLLIRYNKVFTIEFLVSENIDEIFSPDFTPVDAEVLHVTILDQQISYYRSKVIIEEVIIPLFEGIHNEFKPDKAKYTMKIDFERGNPFFGIYMQQLSLDSVREFSFIFTIPSGNKEDYIKVEKEKMTIVSPSLNGLRRAALTALAFNYPGRQECHLHITLTKWRNSLLRIASAHLSH